MSEDEQQPTKSGDEEPQETPARSIAEIDEEERRRDEAASDEQVRREMSRRTRRAFLVGGVAAVAGAASWKWLTTRPMENSLAWPFRRVLDWNANISRSYFSRSRLSPTFRPDQITRKRVNGHQGLDVNFDASKWTLTIENVAGASGPVVVTMDDILKLPRYESIYELRCIEGWSMIVKWTGTRLVDLMAKYPPANRDGSRPDVRNNPDKLVRYVAMETPGRGYYVGLDMESATHPQTMLAYAMNDQDLDWHHGSPLRLAIPVKYGIKNIKRPVVMRYTDIRPPDFWGDRGYDWYAGM